MLHLEKIGLRDRYSFSKIKNVMSLPNLIDIQKDSYKWFLDKGLKEVFDDISPIVDYSGNMILEFVDYGLDGEPKYDVEECKERDANYSTSLQVRIRLITKDKETGEINEGKVQSVYVSDFPVMTPTGTFVVNGAERVIVSQLVRSPGAYYTMEIDKHGTSLYSSQLIPSRGAWLEYETDSTGVTYARVDRTRKLPITDLVRALGIGKNEDIINYFGAEPRILSTLEKDIAGTSDEGVIEIYRRLRPGEPLVVENARSLFESMFFDPRRYDLMIVGRHKLNSKLALSTRLINQTLAEDVVDPMTGEILFAAGEVLGAEESEKIQNSGVNRVVVRINEDKTFPIVGNGTVDISGFDLGFDISEFEVDEKVNFRVLKEILDREDLSSEEKKQLFKESLSLLIPKTITVEDIYASISYNLGLEYAIGITDDIDHLGNRRLRSVGELLQNQFRIGLARLERVVKERMAALDPDQLTPQALVNIKPVNSAIKDFFSSSQLSQFMDQTNPLSELTHKRRLSALGPGGLSRERASFDVRDVHHSHYGRICPIETPEGPNIGLIGSLSTYARVNKYGFIETPYIKVIDGHIAKDKKGKEIIQYIGAEQEGLYTIAQANEPLDENGKFTHERVSGRRGKNRDFVTVEPNLVDFMDISPRQIVSVATAMIPFLENDDANRALMGANMQRQAVPLLIPQAPIVATGMEHRAAKDSGVCIVSEIDGQITRVTADEIIVTNQETGETKRYHLIKFKRSNQGTCLNQHPIVKLYQNVKKGEIIADGPSTDKGDLALGRNVLVGYMTWEGYNYEDAILISEKIVKEDVYTSIHIEEFEVEARDTKLGPEEITRDIAQLSEETLKNLDAEGIIRIGAEVRSDDILVGKVTPKGETELTAEEKLLRAIFGEKAREVRDTSLRVPHGEGGIVVDVKVFTKENGDDLKPGVNKLVRVYLAVKRKISVGDKMAGRHGNKGVISRILPEEDMPFLPDGTPLDIVLSPLGVPSRMNIGQVLEVHLGRACKALGYEIATPVFDGANEYDIADLLKEAGLDDDGKVWLRDGRSGEFFDNRVTVGYSYMLKLHHLVDDKMHARSTGPYSLVTQQPLGGKAQFGGQRFGEMEVWALEAYGAANVLQEILTVKSDDVVGRVKAYEAIVKSENIPRPGIPESFKVLIKEFQSLGLDVNVLDENNNVVEIKDDDDELKRPIGKFTSEDEGKEVDEEELLSEGFVLDGEDEEDDLTPSLEDDEIIDEDEAEDFMEDVLDDIEEDDKDEVIEKIVSGDIDEDM